MKFSVIYEAEVPMTYSVSYIRPPKPHQWRLTEQTDGEPSDWCGELFDGMCKHRKWCAVLDKADFLEFVRQCDVWPEACETMGSLGAPGFGFGWAPAIAFNTDDEVIRSAYVTPLACKRDGTPIRANGGTERDWARIKAAMLSQLQ